MSYNGSETTEGVKKSSYRW